LGDPISTNPFAGKAAWSTASSMRPHIHRRATAAMRAVLAEQIERTVFM
jgi:hypothetical protein